MHKFSAIDVISPNFDLSLLKLNHEDIRNLFKDFRKSAKSLSDEGHFNYMTACNYNPNHTGKFISKHNFISAGVIFTKGIESLVENRFGLENFALHILFDLEARKVFVEESDAALLFLRTEFSPEVMPYFYEKKDHSFEYFSHPAFKQVAIKNIYGNFFDDFEDPLIFKLATKNSFISRQRKLHIFNKYCKRISSEDIDPFNIGAFFSAIEKDFCFELELEPLQCLYRQMYSKMTGQLKINLYKRFGDSNYIDKMIDDTEESVRLFAAECLDPKDDRLMRFASDSSDTVFMTVAGKAHISFIPMFLGRENIIPKSIVEKRLLAKT